MNDMRRTLLWVVFIFSLILLWDRWQVAQGGRGTFFPQTAPSSAAAPAAQRQATDAALPSSTMGAPPAASAVTEALAAQSSESEKVEVSTDVLQLRLDTLGASVLRAELLQHFDNTNGAKDAKHPVVLLDVSPDHFYAVQSGLIGATAGGAYPTHKTLMKVSGERHLKNGQNELSLRFESPEIGGLKLVKTYRLQRGSYLVDVQHEIVNTANTPLNARLYTQLMRDGSKPAGESAFYSTFTGPAIYSSEKRYQKVEFSDIDKGKADFVHQASDGYVAIVQHYFVSAWLLADGLARENFARKIDANLYATGQMIDIGTLQPGQSKAWGARLYLGPQEEKNLEKIAPGLELVKDYGIFALISKPLFWLLDQMQTLLGNWGWAIVGLVVLLKLAFYGLNASAYRSMAKMKAMNPRITEMRQRLKDNPQEMQRQMMAIYKEEKVNPLGGCLPIVIQIPVFIALYWVLLSSVEMRNAPWVLWIKDLSAPDPWYILPALMTATSLLQTWLNPAPPDPMQAKMMWIMPLIFGVMFFFFPSGLVLYWLTNNVLSIIQQWLINKQLGVIGK